ncbi:MAG: hypothetical protein ACTSPB_25310, partial [Candidatus Thorarchaeota archaeon]
PGMTIRQVRDVATAEATKGGVRVAIRRDVIRNGIEVEGAFKQFDIDTMQMIMGGTIVTGGGYTRLYFGSSSGLPAETLWAFKGERVDGKTMWLVIPKGQILSPIEMSVGGEEHASIPFVLGANIDESMTAEGDEEKNLYYWQIND